MEVTRITPADRLRQIAKVVYAKVPAGGYDAGDLLRFADYIERLEAENSRLKQEIEAKS